MGLSEGKRERYVSLWAQELGQPRAEVLSGFFGRR